MFLTSAFFKFDTKASSLSSFRRQVELEQVRCAGSQTVPSIDATAVRRQLWRGGRGHCVCAGCLVCVACLDGGTAEIAVFKVRLSEGREKRSCVCVCVCVCVCGGGALL